MNSTSFAKKILPILFAYNFWKFPIFFADSKSRAQERSNDVSFVIFGHQTWNLEGGKIYPAYPGFQVPQQGSGYTAWKHT